MMEVLTSALQCIRAGGKHNVRDRKLGVAADGWLTALL